jgi:hypothetical protein
MLHLEKERLASLLNKVDYFIHENIERKFSSSILSFDPEIQFIVMFTIYCVSPEISTFFSARLTTEPSSRGRVARSRM